MSVIKCTHCGAEINDSMIFCQYCGTRVELPNTNTNTNATPGAENSNAAPNNANYTQQNSAPYQQYQQQPPYQPPYTQPPYQQPPYAQQPYSQYPYGQVPVGYQPKNRVAAGILAILLGCLGVHNFYLGYTSKAVAQLLITVLSCFTLSFVSYIWGVIEGVQILTGSILTDARGVPLSN